MPLNEFLGQPAQSWWVVDAGDGDRKGYTSKERARRAAVEAAVDLSTRQPSAAVLVIEIGDLPEPVST